MAVNCGGTIMDDPTLLDTLNEHLSQIGEKDDLALVDILNERLSRIRENADKTEELNNSLKDVRT